MFISTLTRWVWSPLKHREIHHSLNLRRNKNWNIFWWDKGHKAHLTTTCIPQFFFFWKCISICWKWPENLAIFSFLCDLFLGCAGNILSWWIQDFLFCQILSILDRCKKEFLILTGKLNVSIEGYKYLSVEKRLAHSTIYQHLLGGYVMYCSS